MPDPVTDKAGKIAQIIANSKSRYNLPDSSYKEFYDGLERELQALHEQTLQKMIDKKVAIIPDPRLSKLKIDPLSRRDQAGLIPLPNDTAVYGMLYFRPEGPTLTFWPGGERLRDALEVIEEDFERVFKPWERPDSFLSRAFGGSSNRYSEAFKWGVRKSIAQLGSFKWDEGWPGSEVIINNNPQLKEPPTFMVAESSRNPEPSASVTRPQQIIPR